MMADIACSFVGCKKPYGVPKTMTMQGWSEGGGGDTVSFFLTPTPRGTGVGVKKLKKSLKRVTLN